MKYGTGREGLRVVSMCSQEFFPVLFASPILVKQVFDLDICDFLQEIPLDQRKFALTYKLL